MIRNLVRGTRLSLLGVVLAALSAGCQDANESEFREGSPKGEGVANPKYAHSSPEAYRQHHQDTEKALTAKTKGAGAPRNATAAPGPAASEPEKKK
jgi:hypothetical protein